jgi:acetyl-CoA C-acetyltransferase
LTSFQAQAFELSNQVAIVGIGQTKYAESRNDVALTELIFEASRKALEDAGLDRKDLDTVVLACQDLVDGRSIANQTAVGASGAYLKDEIRVCNDGAYAVVLGCLQILSGHSQRTLVVSWSKCSETSINTLTNLWFDPFYYRPIALNEVTSLALQAASYMQRYGISEEQAAKVSVRSLLNAFNNPYAHLKARITTQDVLKSKVISWPLRMLNLPPESDGACAIVLASASEARKITDQPAWIWGIGWNVDTYYLGDRDLTFINSLALAARQAYKMAGIDDPRKQIQVAEVHAKSSFSELMIYEALGFCGRGEGGKFVDEGIPEMGGELPVNPSGGTLSSNPYVASGLIRVAESALQVMGRNEKKQVPDARVALAHATFGPCMQGNCVLILGKEPR